KLRHGDLGPLRPGPGASSIEAKFPGDAALERVLRQAAVDLDGGQRGVSTMPSGRPGKRRARSRRLLRARFGLLGLVGMVHMVPGLSNAASRNSGVGMSQTEWLGSCSSGFTRGGSNLKPSAMTT